MKAYRMSSGKDDRPYMEVMLLLKRDMPWKDGGMDCIVTRLERECYLDFLSGHERLSRGRVKVIAAYRDGGFSAVKVSDIFAEGAFEFGTLYRELLHGSQNMGKSVHHPDLKDLPRKPDEGNGAYKAFSEFQLAAKLMMGSARSETGKQPANTAMP
jgi:hypothetical protein